MSSKNNSEKYDQEKRKTKIGKEYENSSFNSHPRGLGDVTQPRSEAWNNKIGTSRKTGERRNISRSSTGREIPGGTIHQLIIKAEEQLVVLQNSAEETKNYISDLKEILELIEDNDSINRK